MMGYKYISSMVIADKLDHEGDLEITVNDYDFYIDYDEALELVKHITQSFNIEFP